METTTFAWDRLRRSGTTPIPVVVLRLPLGERYYSVIHPGDDIVTYGTAWSATVAFSASTTYDGGGAVADRGARVLAVDGITEASIANTADMLAAVSQAERAHVRVELDNRDRAMSAMVGREWVIGRTMDVYLGFPGLRASQSLRRFTGPIDRYTLTSRALILEAEASA